jgi:hypothetical protein
MNLNLKNDKFDTRVLYHILQGIVLSLIFVSLIIFLSRMSFFAQASEYLFGQKDGASALISSDSPYSEPKEPEPPAKSIRVLFTGDMMFDRGVRSQVNIRGFESVIGPASTTFSTHDLVVANLEGTITSYPSKLVLENNKAIPGFQFTFRPDTAEALKTAGVDIVSLANNHSMDFGKDGEKQTRSYLDKAGVGFFGSYYNNQNISTTTCPAEDFCIGLVAWNEFGQTNGESIVSEIERLSSTTDYIVVYPHWGVEYQSQPTAQQRQLAQLWIDNGADIIVGHHPHIVQRIEMYQGKPIFYSLGNTLFDQYFSFNTTHGIILSIEFKKEKITSALSAQDESSEVFDVASEAYVPKFSIIPFTSVGSRINIPTASSTEKLFKYVRGVSMEDLSWLSFGQ